MLNDKIFILKDTFVYFTQKAHSRQKCVNFHIKKAYFRQKCVNFHIEIYFKTGFNLLYLGLQDFNNLQSWGVKLIFAKISLLIPLSVRILWLFLTKNTQIRGCNPLTPHLKNSPMYSINFHRNFFQTNL